MLLILKKHHYISFYLFLIFGATTLFGQEYVGSKEYIGPVASYYFSRNANDTIGGHNGVVRGPILSQDRFGNPNSAYCFDGKNDYINLGTNTIFKQVVLSISLWVKINGKDNNSNNYANQPFVFTRVRDSLDYFEAYFVGLYRPNNKFDAANTSSIERQIPSMSSTIAELNKWYHIVYMFDTDTSYLYVNSKLEQKNFKGFFTTYLESDSVVLGYVGNHRTEKKIHAYLNGCLDDIKFFKRLLSPAEVEALYNEPNPLLGLKFGYYQESNTLKDLLIRFWYLPIILVSLSLLIWLLVKLRISNVRKRDKEKYDLRQQLMQMEMNALRSQMNPHFIFNAINSIQHYVLMNEKDLANKYLVKFSRVVRNVLELSKEDLINLNDELETIRLYVEIESLRFEQTFNFKLNFPDNLENENILVPPLIIQPFVENAIWHGLLLKEGERELSINVFKEDLLLIIEIDDNGVGRAAAGQFIKKETRRKSLGMEITQSRLNVMEKANGISISIKIEDKVDELNRSLGTKVIVTMKLKSKTL